MGSYRYGVSPSLEQRWREEVLYLHSLWHKGPPRNPNPRPNSNNLGPSNPTTFKKRKNKHEDAKKKKDPKPIVSEVEWPCGPDPEPRQETGWPQSNSQSDQATRPATAEEQAKSTALYLQQKGLKACQDIFSSKVCSDEEEEEEFMDDDVDESEEFKFFMGIFTDNRDLRSYYEKNWESGEFCCLVCGGTGKKVWKRFKNCVALVQHSTAISKTKRRAAHRAFGKTICRVLGWEIHRLPSIVLSMDGPLGRSLAKAECEENSAQKKDLQENYVDLDDDDDDDDDEEMDPDYIPGVDVQDDDDEEETDPAYHIPGIDVQKEDFQGQVVNSVTVEKDYGVSIQEEDFQGKAFKIETGRPQSNFQSDQAARPVTVEEQAKSTAHHLQQKGLKACQDFFSSKVCADDEEEEELMDDDVDESEEFKFFVRIFTDNRDLRSYYEKNWESGEFCCLVCGGTGKKVWKRFKNCVALVQHSTAISKTKRRAAHRAFGKTICQVLGWEIHQLPRIFLSMDGPLGRSLAKAECEVGLKEDSAKKEDLRENYVDLVDDDDEEPDPDDHGVGIQKEDFQGKVVDSVTIDEDEWMDIQVGTKNNEELHQKDLTSEIVEMEGACNEDEIDHRTR